MHLISLVLGGCFLLWHCALWNPGQDSCWPGDTTQNTGRAQWETHYHSRTHFTSGCLWRESSQKSFTLTAKITNCFQYDHMLINCLTGRDFCVSTNDIFLLTKTPLKYKWMCNPTLIWKPKVFFFSCSDPFSSFSLTGFFFAVLDHIPASRTCLWVTWPAVGDILILRSGCYGWTFQ